MSGPVKDPLRALQGARSRAQGGRLEEQIEASCALLTETGRADISKTPEPMKPVSQPNKSGQFRAVYVLYVTLVLKAGICYMERRSNLKEVRKNSWKKKLVKFSKRRRVLI